MNDYVIVCMRWVKEPDGCSLEVFNAFGPFSETAADHHDLMLSEAYPDDYVFEIVKLGDINDTSN